MKPVERCPWTPLRIACIYAFLGVLWILFSDVILLSFTSDPEFLSHLQTGKGWFFVLVTACLLYALMRSMMLHRDLIMQDLRKSEEYNRLLFELSPIGFVLCRLDGSIVDVNSAYAGIIGRSVEETLRLTYWDITPENYAKQKQAQLKSLEETGRYGTYEKEYLHSDGHLVPVWGSISPKSWPWRCLAVKWAWRAPWAREAGSGCGWRGNKGEREKGEC